MQLVVYCMETMRSSPQSDLEQFLDHLAHEARPGDRLPTIRELMKRFGVSQVLVQRAFQGLKDRGLIDSRKVGIAGAIYDVSTGRVSFLTD